MPSKALVLRTNMEFYKEKRMKEQVLAVQRMQDYIEKNNAKEIILSDLASADILNFGHSGRRIKKCRNE